MTDLFTKVKWCSSPEAYWTVQYEYRRSGADMQYRFYWHVWLKSSGGWYYNAMKIPIYLNGTNVETIQVKYYNDSEKGWSKDGTTGWYTVSNKTSGTTTAKFQLVDTGGYYQTNWNVQSTQGDFNLPIVSANTSVSQSFNSKTATSITMNWSTTNTVDYIWYSKDNGSTWIDVGSVDSTSGSYTINNLSSYTTYNIKTRARRKDTQVNTNYSDAMSVTTYKAYSYVTSATVGNIMPFTCTAYCTSSNAANTDSYEYSLCNSSYTVLSTQYKNATSCDFSGLAEETTYYIRCRVRSTDSQVWSGYVYSSAFTTPPDQAKGYIKVDGAWKLGKVYIKVNGSWVKAKKAYLKYNDGWNISRNP